MANDAFRAELVELVKASGQELIDRAEEIVGDTTMISDFDISIDFGLYEGHLDTCPKITVNHEYFARNTIKVLSEKFEYAPTSLPSKEKKL